MPTRKPKEPSQNKMEFEIDVSEMMGFRVNSAEAKEVIGQAIIDTLVDRTQGKKSLSGGNFKQYTKKYAEKKGVGRKDVDLKLTEDMQSSIDVRTNSSQKIKIFVEEDQAPKAYNHHVGDTLPKREWFGIQQKELDQLARQLQAPVRRIEGAVSEPTQESDIITQDDVDALLGAITEGLLDFG